MLTDMTTSVLDNQPILCGPIAGASDFMNSFWLLDRIKNCFRQSSTTSHEAYHVKFHNLTTGQTEGLSDQISANYWA